MRRRRSARGLVRFVAPSEPLDRALGLRRALVAERCAARTPERTRRLEPLATPGVGFLALEDRAEVERRVRRRGTPARQAARTAARERDLVRLARLEPALEREQRVPEVHLRHGGHGVELR